MPKIAVECGCGDRLYTEKIMKKELLALRRRIDKKLKEAGKIRDEIRVMHSELEDLLEDWDTGLDDIQTGLNLVQSGVDTLSKNV